MKRFLYVVGTDLVLLFCLMPAVYAADGFGENATGGGGGSIVVVDNAADFKELVETVDVPYVVQVLGSIDLGSVGGTVRIHSNKTIAGVGCIEPSRNLDPRDGGGIDLSSGPGSGGPELRRRRRLRTPWCCRDEPAAGDSGRRGHPEARWKCDRCGHRGERAARPG